ncbi:MAG: DUF547 domain-containing protein [bacterium]|nr:DUF547 domain-containing protein [bacterium]
MDTSKAHVTTMPFLESVPMTAHPTRSEVAPSPRRDSLRRLFRAITILALVSFSGPGPLRAETEADLAPIDLPLFARILEGHTRAAADIVGTRVNYESLKKSSDWEQLTLQVRRAKPSQLARNERIAYWINAYNILTIDLVLKHYPVESIRDIGSFFFPVWDKTVATIEGREISLGFIEHEILRKLDEPRIHAAIVCASTSCPPLSRTPFHADALDQELNTAMRVWLASSEKAIAIDRANHRIRLSAIFDWFEEDFRSRGGVLSAIAPHVSNEDAEWLRGSGRDATIRYFDYDWTLNDFE